MPNLIVGLGAAMPAFAESFPSNGYMLENKTYSNAATYNNMGVYEGTVTASAEYEDILYQIIGGTYLPAGATVAEQCPANSYCPGATGVTYNESESQGISSCPSGYPNSAAGASSNTQCYTACTVSMVEHASAVSGNDYYGDGPDTCFATACENGYHVYETVKVIEQRPLIDVDYTTKGNLSGAFSINGNGRAFTSTYNPGHGLTTSSSGVAGYGLTENNTWAMKYGDVVIYGHASCQATRADDPVFDYLDANYDAIMAGTISLDQVRSDLTPIVGAAKANFTADVVASEVDGTASEEDFERLDVVLSLPEDASFSTTDTGVHCYCQMTGFLLGPSGESGYDISKAVAVESVPWVYYSIDYGSENVCASECAKDCMGHSIMVGDFRKKLFGAIRVTDASTCDANEITINWSDAAEEDIAANNAGMCTYGGDIRTPIKAATKPGKTFVGWKFSKKAE